MLNPDLQECSLLDNDHSLRVVVALERRDFHEAELQFRKPLLCTESVNLDGRHAANLLLRGHIRGFEKRPER